MRLRLAWGLTLLRGHGRERRDHLAHTLAPAMRAGDAALFGFRDMEGQGELLVAVVAMEVVLRHSRFPATY